MRCYQITIGQFTTELRTHATEYADDDQASNKTPVAGNRLRAQQDLDPFLALHQFEAMVPVAEGKLV
jgi:hypothetical protein